MAAGAAGRVAFATWAAFCSTISRGTGARCLENAARRLRSATRLIKRGQPSHVTASLTERPLLTAEEIRERMSGNICRCGAYSNIVDAITEVAGRTA